MGDLVGLYASWCSLRSCVRRFGWSLRVLRSPKTICLLSAVSFGLLFLKVSTESKVVVETSCELSLMPTLLKMVGLDACEGFPLMQAGGTEECL